MYKLTVKEEGKLQDIENFDNFAELKQHLIDTDYFGWIQEEEPERELPNFEDVESVQDIEEIFEEFDYSWWTMEVEVNEEENKMKNIKDMTVEEFYSLDEVSVESDGFYYVDNKNDISEMVATPKEAFTSENEWNGEDY